MGRTGILATLLLCSLPTVTWAAPPRVAVDIAPLHSIAAQVMEGVGQPDLLIQPEASPHSYSLRPSEAEALAEADVVFWISKDLTPWLESPLETLAGSATQVEMLELSVTEKHEFREGATFEGHDHGPGHEEGEHGEADEHHDDDEKHHNEGKEGHHGAHHGEHDPHAWLDPINAKRWANEMASVLAKTDAANAEVYQNNARAFGESINEMTGSLNRRASELGSIQFVVFHDAYQYFERRFGLEAAGAISLSDASDPSPARIREIQTLVSELGVTCAFTEPQYNSDLVTTVFEGSEVRTTGVMDPLGVSIEVGPGLYSELLNGLMASLEQCRS